MDGLNIPLNHILLVSSLLFAIGMLGLMIQAQHYIYIDVIGGNAQCSRIGFCRCRRALGTT